MIWNLIGTIGGKVLDIVDDVVEDKDEANKLKFQIQKQLMESKTTELEAQAKIVLAEAQGSWLQRNRRPPCSRGHSTRFSNMLYSSFSL